MKHDVLLSAVLGVIVSLSTPDFIEIQKLSPDELLRRFRLPAGCNPAVTAMTTDATANRMTVAIECRPGSLQAVPAGASAESTEGGIVDGHR